MPRIALALTLITLTTARPGFAQGQDTNGDSTIVPAGILSATLLEANTPSASVKINFLHRESESDDFWGLQLQGKANNGLSQVFRTGDVQPGAKFGLNWGHSNLATKNTSNFDWINVQANYEVSRIALIESSAPYASQFRKSTFSAPSFSISYNYALRGAIIFWGSAGYAKVNNYSDLRDATITRETRTTDPNNASTLQVITTSTTTGKTGTYAENHASVLQAGLFWIAPNTSSRLGIYAYQRSTLTKDVENRGIDCGTSVLILKSGNPLVPLGGLTVALVDAFDSRGSANPLGRRFQVGLTATIPLGFVAAP
jgi:hypothetical protein